MSNITGLNIIPGSGEVLFNDSSSSATSSISKSNSLDLSNILITNLGVGAKVFSSKSSNEIDLRSITNGPGIIINQRINDILISIDDDYISRMTSNIENIKFQDDGVISWISSYDDKSKASINGTIEKTDNSFTSNLDLDADTVTVPTADVNDSSNNAANTQYVTNKLKNYLTIDNKIKNINLNNDLTLEVIYNDNSTSNFDLSLQKDTNGYIFVPDNIGTLPSDLVLNGSIYTAPDSYSSGQKSLPTGLSLNGNIVMTDGTTYFKNTINNSGILCAA